MGPVKGKNLSPRKTRKPTGRQKGSPRSTPPKPKKGASKSTPTKLPPTGKADTPNFFNFTPPTKESAKTPTITNATKDPPPVDKVPPKPAPPPDTPYKDALTDSIDKPMTDPSQRSTFLIQKEIYDAVELDFPDDDTIGDDNTTQDVSSYKSLRMTMMFKLPGKEEGCDDDDAPLIAIQKMNDMIKALTNKLPCFVGPWKNNVTYGPLKKEDLMTVLPDDIDFVESYVFDYNRFLGAGKTGYVRLHIFYSDLTSVSEIESVVSQFKKPRERFFEISHSPATSPIHIGCLTGSVRAMSESHDFLSVMKNRFDLKELGLYFTQPRNSGDHDRAKYTVHLEIDRSDQPKRNTMEQYFNHSPRSLNTTFFGTPMLLTKPYDYFAEDDVKANLEMHSRKQTSLGKSMRSTVVTGVQLNNWADSTKTTTLLHALMSVESIVAKKIVKGKKTSSFFGRLFYAIIPDKKRKSVTFYYSRANFKEGRSVARGMPLFIRDHFKLDPAFFCSSEALTEALDGVWDNKKRFFLSSEEKIEGDRLDDMEDQANAEVAVFISKDHQRALTLDDDTVISDETRLTKGDKAPPGADDMSEMTGSTRESKAKRYADSAVKDVAAQYSSTIANMNNDLGVKDDRIEQLELLVRNMSKPPLSQLTTDELDAQNTPNSTNHKNTGTLNADHDSDIDINSLPDDDPSTTDPLLQPKRKNSTIDDQSQTSSKKTKGTQPPLPTDPPTVQFTQNPLLASLPRGGTKM